MHTIYKAASLEDTRRILDYCRSHATRDGGLFEVYPGPEKEMGMVIVNSCSADGQADTFLPLGTFYCNYAGPGVISIEEDESHCETTQSNKRHIAAIKQVIDILLRDGHPGNKIQLNDLLSLKS